LPGYVPFTVHADQSRITSRGAPEGGGAIIGRPLTPSPIAAFGRSVSIADSGMVRPAIALSPLRAPAAEAQAADRSLIASVHLTARAFLHRTA